MTSDKKAKIIQNLEDVVNVLLSDDAKSTSIKDGDITKRIDTMCPAIDPDNLLEESDKQNLVKKFQSRFSTTMDFGTFLVDNQFYTPWLDEVKSSIDFYYSKSYEKMLNHEYKFSNNVIQEIDNQSNKIVGLLENPKKEGNWDRRGLVVGWVQSGKTANYIAVINKAADAGYKLIIVISGTSNYLRTQTQERIDYGFIGKDSSTMFDVNQTKSLGVGLLRPEGKKRWPTSYTNRFKDFNKNTTTVIDDLASKKEPSIMVIKKHTNPLTNLIVWSMANETLNIPILVIDDEADNASINTKYAKDNVTKINSLIRELLKKFNKSCYIGYTATPFANIFIDPDTEDEMLGDDLFPSNFIVSLDPPSNYYGPEKMFANDPPQTLRYIDDNEDIFPLKHKTYFELIGLPPSLKKAIRTFILIKTLRIERGELNKHHSMLVNVSIYTDVHRQVKNEIQRFLKEVTDSIKLYSQVSFTEAMMDSEIKKLHETWLAEFEQEDITWDQIQARLIDSTLPIEVIEVNAKSNQSLNYKDNEQKGLSVIAVGGYVFSRGFTLEGLSVTYLLRNTMMSDTLMQMARFFGYRDGYENLCRIWMPEQTADSFSSASDSIIELRQEFTEMSQVKATPKQYGLKVRQHPNSLEITARNKMGSAKDFKFKTSLSGKYVETSAVHISEKSFEKNIKAIQNMTEAMKQKKYLSNRVKGSTIFTDVSVDIVLDFIQAYENYPLSAITNRQTISAYINELKNTELATWDIAFWGIAESKYIFQDLGFPINLSERIKRIQFVNEEGQPGIRFTNNRVADPGIEKLGLSDLQIQNIENKFKSENTNIKISYPGRIYRMCRKKPILIIQLIIAKNPSSEIEWPEEKPVPAWGISFPKSKLEDPIVDVVYKGNKVFQNEQLSFSDHNSEYANEYK